MLLSPKVATFGIPWLPYLAIWQLFWGLPKLAKTLKLPKMECFVKQMLLTIWQLSWGLPKLAKPRSCQKWNALQSKCCHIWQPGKYYEVCQNWLNPEVAKNGMLYSPKVAKFGNFWSCWRLPIPGPEIPIPGPEILIPGPALKPGSYTHIGSNIHRVVQQNE